VAEYRAESLHGRWVHSHEEDSAGERVFRPPSYDFPPTRQGRTSIELRPDGTYVERAPGATDAPEEAGRGSWSVEGDRILLGSDSWEITAAEPDRLTVKQ
jgi:hypothetical protein